MIGSLANDLLTKLKTISAFGTSPPRVGLTIGAKTLDPLLEKITKPACWVVFTADNPATEKVQTCKHLITYTFVVKIILEYSNDTDMINNQYPVLESVISLLDGSQGPQQAEKWRYIGQSVEEITDTRVIFNQTYNIVGTL